MGYALVPDIKDEAVVCQKGCNHRDCEANRKMFGEAKCAICGGALRAGEKFFQNDEGKLEHAVCVWEQEEERRR